MPVSPFSDHGSGPRFCLTRGTRPLAPGSGRSMSAARHRAVAAAMPGPALPDSNVGLAMPQKPPTQRQRRADRDDSAALVGPTTL